MIRRREALLIYLFLMATSTLLCIHRNPPQLRLLQEHGYELATVANASDGLRLIMSRSVDAVVVEHGPNVDGAAIANEIKHVRPEVPIIMLADHTEIPATALKSVDALVVKADGPHFLLATVHFMLSVRPIHRRRMKIRSNMPDRSSHPIPSTTTSEPEVPFSREVWQDIKSGNIRF